MRKGGYEMTYGVTHLTKTTMIVQAGASPGSDIESNWTGKGINAVRLEIDGKELWGVKWEAMVHGDKIIATIKG